MRLIKAKQKNSVQIKIHTYKRRREKIRDDHGVTNGRKATPYYHREVATINKKIRGWEKTLVRIQKRKNMVMALGNHIAYFMGIILKGAGNQKDKRMMQAKGIFCKYGMEHGIPGVLLSEYIGSYPDFASRYRMAFTRSFQTNRENKEIWDRFTLYMRDEETRRQEETTDNNN